MGEYDGRCSEPFERGTFGGTFQKKKTGVDTFRGVVGVLLPRCPRHIVF